MTLTTAQLDRACGTLLASAAGDALGAPYEFGPPLPAPEPVGMVGGGDFSWAPGEWTDDTAMATAIAEVAATGAALRDEQAQGLIVRRWCEWASDAKDVGIQTREVLRDAAGRDGQPTAQRARDAATALHRGSGRSGGNGSFDAHRTRGVGLPRR